MYIGYMGDVVFYTSQDDVLTPSEVSRSGAARWSEHNVLMQKPVSQFSGPGLENMSFKILISKSLGQAPKKVLNKLRNMRDTGAVFPLIIGGEPVSQFYWRITDFTEDNLITDAYGETYSIKVSLNLKEYDDTNIPEEQSKLNVMGIKLNKINTLLGGRL